jgi:hypothetical protein
MIFKGGGKSIGIIHTSSLFNGMGQDKLLQLKDLDSGELSELHAASPHVFRAEI